MNATSCLWAAGKGSFWIPSFPVLLSHNYVSLELITLISFVAKCLDKQLEEFWMLLRPKGSEENIWCFHHFWHLLTSKASPSPGLQGEHPNDQYLPLPPSAPLSSFWKPPPNWASLLLPPPHSHLSGALQPNQSHSFLTTCLRSTQASEISSGLGFPPGQVETPPSGIGCYQ